jgi:predicted HicB family RNase H-like nuclease
MDNKRLILNVPIELHSAIKVRAAIRNITMRTWIIRVLIEAIAKEDKYNNPIIEGTKA